MCTPFVFLALRHCISSCYSTLRFKQLQIWLNYFYTFLNASSISFLSSAFGKQYLYPVFPWKCLSFLRFQATGLPCNFTSDEFKKCYNLINHAVQRISSSSCLPWTILIFPKEAEIRTGENSLFCKFIRVGIFTGKGNPLVKPKGAKKDGEQFF